MLSTLPLPRLPRPVAPEMVPIVRDDAEALSRLHALAFDAPGGGWGAGEFASLLAQSAVFGHRAVRPAPGPLAHPFQVFGAPAIRATPDARGFVLLREAAGEAEVLTIAVHPAWQGRGVGRLLMDAALRELYARRAEALFLEVDEGNAPALALYRRLGFAQVGRREGYYGGAAALTMRLDLQP